VRYEDLVADPETVLRAVCAFLGEAFDPAMLSLEGAETFRGRGGNSSYGRHSDAHISPRSVGRYRSVLSDRELCFMQSRAGREMRRMGYAPIPVRLSSGDRLRYLVYEQPLNLIRMAIWRVLVGMSAAGPKALSRRSSGGRPEWRRAAVSSVGNRGQGHAIDRTRRQRHDGSDLHQRRRSVRQDDASGLPDLPPSDLHPGIGSTCGPTSTGSTGTWRTCNFERPGHASIQARALPQPDAQRIREEFKAGAPTYGRLFAIFQRQHAERNGKARWGDQSGLIERYADEVFAAYPEAVMLHLVRDPRDRWEAVRARWGDGHGGVGGSTARWRYSARLSARNLARYSDRYAVVRFEDLILRPEATLRAVCDLISETYSPEMLTMSGALEYRARLSRDPETAEALTGPPLDTVRGPYQAASARDVVFIESAARSEMARFDYPPAAPSLRGADRLRYPLATWPLNELRLTGWMARERLQQRAPGRIGRQPSRDKVVA
jgi:hypothetical protein